MIPGWRARIHYWSRHEAWLKRVAILLSVGSFLAALGIIALTPEATGLAADPLEQARRQEWQALMRETGKRPREVTLWLRRTLAQVEHLADVLGLEPTSWESYQKDARLAAYETRELLQKHALEESQITLWRDFIEARLDGNEAAQQRLQAQAAKEPAVPMAAELWASLLVSQRKEAEALTALLLEAQRFPDAQQVRVDAVNLALLLEDRAFLQLAAADPAWRGGWTPLMKHRVGILIGDLRLDWLGLLEHRLSHLWSGAVALTCFTGSLWYVILVLHGGAGRARWVWPLLPLLAGVGSVWPVLTFGAWQETALGLVEDAPFPGNLWYQIAGVGLREELCKLALAALFMPWLLKKRHPGRALMTGAFIGLGFALEENIQYYQDYGGGVAVVRFFSANFMHAAMTGLTTQALYELLRSRFGTAERFLITLLGVITLHGCYNFGASLGDGGAGSFLSMVLLAALAWRFLDTVGEESPRGRQWVSPAAVFLLGTALLMAVIFLTVAIREGDRLALVSAAQECVGVLPLTFIYWRRLGA